MMGLETIGRWLLIGGLALALLGGTIWLLARAFPGISQLPGTIRVQGEGFTCVFPLLASILLSIVLTVLLNLLARFFK